MAREIGIIIQELRKERNMTQMQLAKMLYVAPNTISNYENDTSVPSIEMLKAMADVFNVSADVLLDRSMDSRIDVIASEYMRRLEELYIKFHPEHVRK